ncbi:MAG TPA: energy transducer TonB [Pyrinomonadaceae bacterium]|nr:energy transducer TonB [Pyrinomonadaceae bacterium]
MRAALLCLIVLSHSAFPHARAQEVAPVPFAEVEKQVRAQRGGWSGPKEPLTTLFNAERVRLGKEFEAELLKYLGTDVEKHYWVALLLTDTEYLRGNEPLPELSLLVADKALSLLGGKEDEEGLGHTVAVSVNAAVVSEKIERHPAAVAYKRKAETLLSKDPDLGAFFPALGQEERRLYDTIEAGGVNGSPAPDAEQGPPAKIVGGILNGKALNLPKPVYPREAEAAGASGEVKVKIVFDESGNVIWAKAVSGHKLLLATSEEAAYKAKFPPVAVRDKNVKVTGFLVYRFISK